MSRSSWYWGVHRTYLGSRLLSWLIVVSLTATRAQVEELAFTETELRAFWRDLAQEAEAGRLGNAGGYQP
jgi:hypothetical protein